MRVAADAGPVAASVTSVDNFGGRGQPHAGPASWLGWLGLWLIQDKAHAMCPSWPIPRRVAEFFLNSPREE